MDPERTIRFLYPPLFLIASLLWGLWLDTAKSLGDSRNRLYLEAAITRGCFVNRCSK